MERHGQAKGGKCTPEYQAYLHAKRLCENPHDRKFKYYGGRGIQFFFKSFEEFFAALGPRPSPKHSLDRFPNGNGHYERGNVRWATAKEQ